MSALRVVAALLVALAGLAIAPAAAAPSTPSVRSSFVSVPEAPGSSSTIRLDTTVYTPAVTPAPAVLLAHGFGQTKTDLASEARRLQAAGYVVLAYTARGFGRSGGEIALDSLDAEVPDARALVSRLAADPRVDASRIGVVGGSYGGALALMVGATDPRIRTVVAAITWNDLATALDPASAGGLRDFKSAWAARLFAAGIGNGGSPCGRFTPQFCALYRTLVSGGTPNAADLALLARSSPATVLAHLRAPTLLLQGIQDSLFGLDQADANARAIRAAGGEVQVRWFDGGHDGGGIAGTDGLVTAWLAAHLRGSASVDPRFAFDVPESATSFAETLTAPSYPGLDGTASAAVPLLGGAQTVVNPPGGQPQAVTGIPGVSASSRAGSALARVLGAADPRAGQASFVSAPLTRTSVLAGRPSIRVRIAPPSGSPGQALLYGQLTVRAGSGETALPGGVAPLRVALPAGGATVDLALPATVADLAPGDRVVLTLRTTDSQWTGSTAPAAFRVALAGSLELPTVATIAATRTAGLPSPWVLGGIALVLLLGVALILVAALRSRRAPAATADAPQLEHPPLVIRGLEKRFRSGFTAVDDVSFTVERGQVLGLLGENGAGKTTTLRMVAGLMRPDAGSIEAFGAPVVPGAAVLARLGCFIEGPGFLPHLSGRRNLELYWAATGRPRAEARMDEALAVADLGGAVAKPVRGYSQGMRQRLAIAQAMLGMPDVLVLDEPTNGLDPPQITALRGVLQRYAAGGRTVVVSSHLLGEVQRTCSHVVVMSHGRLVAAGPVAEVASGGDLEAAFLDLIGATEPSA